MKLKNLLCCALATVMLAGSALAGTVGVNAETEEKLPFSDVKEKNWFYNSVKFVYDEGIINGYTDGTFKPKENLTRAEFVTILGRLAGATSTTRDTFTDTKKNTWYSEYIGWAVENGIITGFPDNTFRPNDKITREQIAAAISRYIEAEGINMPRRSTAPDNFADEGKISKWAKEYMEVLRRAGIFNGDQSENCNPQVNISRAEAATVIVNLIEAEALAWQGYSPDTEADGYGIFGANYIYWNGTVFTDYRNRPEYDHGRNIPTFYKYQGLDLVTDGLDYPALSVPSDTKIGISCDVAQIDIRETPVVKVCYAYAKGNPDSALTGLMNINVDAAPQWGRKFTTESVTLTPGADDAGWATATYDLTDFVEKYSDILIIDALPEKVDDLLYFLLTPEDDGDSFMVRYFAFFETKEQADAFTSAQYEDYLKNYSVYTDVEYAELDDATRDEYDKLLADRISEILNSESEITPETITGTAYYISNDGDDSAKGTSPETAWKSIKNLWTYYADDTVRITKLKAGDGVFFRRGDEWYAEQYNNNSVTCLDTIEYVSYGAYGEGEKPLLTCAVDFRDSDNVGIWEETEWENVYVLKNLDDSEEWCRKYDIGSIVFNEGEYLGIRVRSESFGEGVTTKFASVQCNGRDIFVSGGTSCLDPGDALRNNLEYIKVDENLYLRCNDGNPADVFDDIKVARDGFIIAGAKGACIDNIATVYTTNYGMTYGNEQRITNCEIGFCGGSGGSQGSGIEFFGWKGENMLIENCYIHDVEDGPMTNQGDDNRAEGETGFNNIEYSNNVVVSCGNGEEIWLYYNLGWDENMMPYTQIKNAHVHDNIFAYIGYGFTLQQSAGVLGCTGGTLMCGSIGFYVDCEFNDNIMMYPHGDILGSTVATDTIPYGWHCFGNTYLVNAEHAYLYMGYENINTIVTGKNDLKTCRISLPYTYRNIAFFASNGIDSTGTFYWTDAQSEAEAQGCFFMTGYWAEQGGWNP